MKVIICGKGGSGKSTISVLIARALNDRGYKVLLVDGDESNVGLHRLMGISQPVIFLDNLGGKKGFKQSLNMAFPKGNADEILGRSMKFDDLPDQCVADVDGIKMIAIGKIHNEGEGCACPVGMLSKMVLSRLVIEDDEIVIIDAEAGVEHFGRGVVAGSDMVIDVASESIAGQTASTKFNLNSFVDAIGTAGDADSMFTTMAVHSVVLAQMRKNNDIDFPIGKSISPVANAELRGWETISGNLLNKVQITV
jgi:CO dehydrogenase nickel-insertion accessory protein CooC1